MLFPLKEGFLLCAAYTVGFSVVSAIKYSAADYHCENGIYQDLYDLTLAVRFSAYAPFLARLRKKQSYVSGQDIADHMQYYCNLSNNIVKSQKLMMKHIKCLKGEIQNFEGMIRKSHSYCLRKKSRPQLSSSRSSSSNNVTATTADTVLNVAPTGLMEGIGEISMSAKIKKVDPNRNSVVPRILKIFESLPLEHLDYRHNPCYYQAPKRAYMCYLRYTRAQARNSTDLAHSLKRKASSIRCTFRSLARICPRKRAFLLTVMEYDWMIVPPPLDVNIGYFLFRAWRMKTR